MDVVLTTGLGNSDHANEQARWTSSRPLPAGSYSVEQSAPRTTDRRSPPVIPQRSVDVYSLSRGDGVATRSYKNGDRGAYTETGEGSRSLSDFKQTEHDDWRGSGYKAGCFPANA